MKKSMNPQGIPILAMDMARVVRLRPVHRVWKVQEPGPPQVKRLPRYCGLADSVNVSDIVLG